MKFLIAPDSFKESMSAYQASLTIEQAIKANIDNAETLLLPMADGGEGTLSVLVQSLNGKTETFEVTGPFVSGFRVNAEVGVLQGGTAVIEMAQAAGLQLLTSEERNPEITTTLGVGEMILAALDQEVRRFFIALGGSATNDGGLGMLTALGARPLDHTGNTLDPIGASLKSVVRLDLNNLDSRLAQCQFMLACDVDNPLTGAKGASVVFGPQKGATPAQVKALDDGLDNWAEILNETFGRQVKSVPGSGAAGGLAAAFLAAFNCRLKPGVELVLDLLKFDEKCSGVDWVITGEGCLDNQSMAGKTPVGVGRRAKKFGIPVVAFAGQLGEGYDAVYKEGIDLALCITPEDMPLSDALSQAEQNLSNATKAFTKLMFSPIKPSSQ